MSLEGSPIDMKIFKNCTKIMIFQVLTLVGGPACLGWAGSPWVGLARLAQLADRWGWPGCPKYTFFICSSGKPGSSRILVPIPPNVGSVVCIGISIWNGVGSFIYFSELDWAGLAGLGWLGYSWVILYIV